MNIINAAKHFVFFGMHKKTNCRLDRCNSGLIAATPAWSLQLRLDRCNCRFHRWSCSLQLGFGRCNSDLVAATASLVATTAWDYLMIFKEYFGL